MFSFIFIEISSSRVYTTSFYAYTLYRDSNAHTPLHLFLRLFIYFWSCFWFCESWIIRHCRRRCRRHRAFFDAFEYAIHATECLTVCMHANVCLYALFIQWRRHYGHSVIYLQRRPSLSYSLWYAVNCHHHRRRHHYHFHSHKWMEINNKSNWKIFYTPRDGLSIQMQLKLDFFSSLSVMNDFAISKRNTLALALCTW